MTRTRASAGVLLALLLAGPVLADWDPGMPSKWAQLPDLATTGIDVNCSPVPEDNILADDFECTEAGPITGIHIWGSWLDDYLPMMDSPDAVKFTLSIHADIPAEQNPDGYSMPGALLWMYTFDAYTFMARPYEEGILEGWLNPPQDYIFPADTVCWQYNFAIPEQEAFIQEGSSDQPVVYWLDVKAEPQDPNASFGWKTSLDHWNDDAVYGMGFEPYAGPWFELIYPFGHEMEGQSIDLAFVLTGVEQTDDLDFGDAPDPAGAVGYRTLLANDGARHTSVPNVFLGSLIDTEPDGQPTAFATGDDFAGVDDEDGVALTTFMSGTTSTITVTASTAGYLNAWFDWNASGNWLEASELVFSSQPLIAGTNTLNVPTPASAVAGTTCARFRFTSAPSTLSYTGLAPDGEVEDYPIVIEAEPELYDFGDAPEDPTGAGYPTTLAMNGAWHVIVPGFFMGGLVDGEPDGQPDAYATGDDLAGSPDEDGVVFTSPLYPGYPATVDVTVSAPGFLDAWIDFGVDRSWLEAGDQIVSAAPVNPGVNSFTFTVPAGTTPNAVTFARFRLSGVGGLSPSGPAHEGEVEDHEVRIDDKYVLKWIQNPDLSVMGIDVAACTSPDGTDYLLADDFLCTSTGPLTDFRIWGSWLYDELPFGSDPRAVRFVLSIHKDIPAGQVEEYSMPGEVLWWHEFDPGDFGVEQYAEQIEEGWLDPPDGYLFPADWTCWLYRFHVDPHLAFVQEGTEDDPVVYWLDLKAFPLDPQARFGWKTSLEHWNDDAVWGLGQEPYPGPWFELRYPQGHELWGQSIDLAFAVLEDLVTAVPDEEMPRRVGLRQNVPNPFNPSTEIAFEMPAGGARAELTVYDVEGRHVRNLVDAFMDEGPHEVSWDGRDDGGRAAPAGVYFAHLRADGRRLSVKMVLLR